MSSYPKILYSNPTSNVFLMLILKIKLENVLCRPGCGALNKTEHLLTKISSNNFDAGLMQAAKLDKNAR